MDTTEYQTPTFGKLASRTIGTCLGALENRAELFVVEFEEESERMLQLVIFAAGGLFLGMMTMFLVTGIIIFVVPPEYRLYVAVGLAVLYLAGTVTAVFTVKKLLQKTPFAESLKQIKKDAELLEALK
jgi:uncharacterized membrane protein YqjE